MRITESQLRQYVRRMLNEQYQSFNLRQGVPNSELIPPEDLPIIEKIAQNAGGRDFMLEITPQEIHISLFGHRGEASAFLTHNLISDTWTGSGPSERETEMFGERKIDKSKLMKFAEDFGLNNDLMSSLMGIRP